MDLIPKIIFAYSVSSDLMNQNVVLNSNNRQIFYFSGLLICLFQSRECDIS